MKITIKLNLGNYESIDYTTNEYDNLDDCYDEILEFLEDWDSLAGERQKKVIRRARERIHIEGINQPTKDARGYDI